MEIKNLSEVKAERVYPKVLRKVLFYSENLMLVYYEFEPGCKFPIHSHPNEQMGVVLQGKGEYTTNGKKVLTEKDSVYFIKSGETHGFKTLGNKKYVELDIFYPSRREYI